MSEAEQTQAVSYAITWRIPGKVSTGRWLGPLPSPSPQDEAEVVSGHARAAPPRMSIRVSLFPWRCSKYSQLIFRALHTQLTRSRNGGESVFFYPLCLEGLLAHAGDTTHASRRRGCSKCRVGDGPSGFSFISHDTRVRCGENQVVSVVLSPVVTVPTPPQSLLLAFLFSFQDNSMLHHLPEGSSLPPLWTPSPVYTASLLTL